MRQTIQFTLLCFLVVSAAFAGRPIPVYTVSDYDSLESLESRIIPLDGGERAIGVYRITGARNEDLTARIILNQRVDYFIERGVQPPGAPQLQVLVRSGVQGDELRPADRAVLMFLRLHDIDGDIPYWLNESCLDSASNAIIENSLIECLMYHMRDALEQFWGTLHDEQPFTLLIDNGIDAHADDFTDYEYERMHDYFQRYVDFVEQVLSPWRGAWEGESRNIHLQGDFWRRRLGDVLNFRTYAQGHAPYAQAHLRNTGGLERVGPFGEADDRIDAVDQGPLDALIAMVLMEGMLYSMHDFWAELRGVLNEQDHDDMLCYRTAEQVGDETPEDAVYRRLATLNGLLVVQNLVPIEGDIKDQGAFNRNVAQLYREIRNHVLLLYRYANTGTRREGDWEAFMEAGRTVDALIDEHFAFDDPLDFGDEEEPEDVPDRNEDAMELSDEHDDDDGGYDAFSWQQVGVVGGAFASTFFFTYGSPMNRHGL